MKVAKAQAARRVVALALTGRAERVVTQVKQETGITHVAFLERLLEWYAAQDPRLRTMILSPYPQVRSGLARLLSEEMRAHPEKDFDAIPRFDALIDHDFGPDEKPEDSAIDDPNPSKGARRRLSSSKRLR